MNGETQQEIPRTTQSERKPPRISVVIPVRNDANKIEQCLTAVLAQSIKPYEVIVVDGRSDDGTVEKAQLFPVKVLYEDYHNRAGACQVGINNASGEYIAFTDADCVPAPDWLANLEKELKEGVAGAGGRYEDIGRGFWTRVINLTFRTPLSGAKSRWAGRRIVKNLSVCGANGLCRRQDILKVGGFRVTLSGAEDLELSRRIAQLGDLVYAPEAVVQHNHERGLTDFAKQAYRYGGWRRESRLWDWQVIPPLVAPLLLLSLLFTPWLFLGTLAGYISAVTVAGAKIARQEKRLIYLVAVPIAFLAQHFFYIVGFWKETIRPRKKGVYWK